MVEATWKGKRVAVKIFHEILPRHMLGRKGSGNLEAMMETLECACARAVSMLPSPLRFCWRC